MTSEWGRAHWLFAAAAPTLLAISNVSTSMYWAQTRDFGFAPGGEFLVLALAFNLWTVSIRIAWEINQRWFFQINDIRRWAGAHLLNALITFPAIVVIANLGVQFVRTGAFDYPRMVRFLESDLLANLPVFVLAHAAAVGILLLLRSKDETSSHQSVTIPVKSGRQTVFLRSEQIIWAEAMDNYVCIHTLDANFTERRTLASLETELPANMFMRTHRRALVNLRHATAIEKEAGGSYFVHLANDLQAPLSRTKVKTFEQSMKEGRPSQ